jgi:hypothetical protein
MLHLVVWQIQIDVSEELTASIIRAQGNIPEDSHLQRVVQNKHGIAERTDLPLMLAQTKTISNSDALHKNSR